MLKRLRWKYILTAECAVGIVLILLAAGINLFYRAMSVRGLDDMLQMIAENEGSPPSGEEGGDPDLQTPWGFSVTPETPFETRFFTVRETDSEISEKQMDFIASVTGEDAEMFYRTASQSGKTSGFIGSYRFLRDEAANSTLYVFLDCSRQLLTFRNLLMISLVTAIGAAAAVFLLLYFLSPKAIAPTVQNMERQQQFITNASHAIKTPLTVIASYADVLCMEGPDNEWASGIQAECRNLSVLVSRLILLSRLDEVPHTAEKSVVDFTQLLWDTAVPYRNLAEKNGKRMVLRIEENLHTTGTEVTFQTAVATLMENALQYAPEGDDIQLEAFRKKRQIVLECSNNLPEGNPPDLQRIFDRFYRADDSRDASSGGSGIGLSLARAAAEANGGKLTAEFVQNRRILFRFTFPAAKTDLLPLQRPTV